MKNEDLPAGEAGKSVSEELLADDLEFDSDLSSLPV